MRSDARSMPGCQLSLRAFRFGSLFRSASAAVAGAVKGFRWQITPKATPARKHCLWKVRSLTERTRSGPCCGSRTRIWPRVVLIVGFLDVLLDEVLYRWQWEERRGAGRGPISCVHQQRYRGV